MLIFSLAIASTALSLSLARAQTYPPVIGGGGGGTGGVGGVGGVSSGASTGGVDPIDTGTGNGSTSGTAGTTSTQSACDLSHCLRYSGKIGGAFVFGKAEEHGALQVAALQGCCESFARVDLYIESERIFLGTVYAAEDGSYLGKFTIPASIKPGLHHIIANIQGCGELRGSIEIVPAGGTAVLGSTVRNATAGGGGSGGILPRTGASILRFLIWALILIAFGSLLVMATWKYGQRYAVVRAVGRRFVKTRRHAPALPAPGIPFIDTSRFVPYRSKVGDGDAVSRASRRLRGSSAWNTRQKSKPTT